VISTPEIKEQLPEPIAAPETEAQTEEPVVHKNETRKVYFDSGKATISAKSRKVISSLTAHLRTLKKYEITLNGYTDSKGNEDANLALSKRRAEAVKKVLIQSGLNPKAITIFAFGKEHDGKKVSESEQRVVEIVVEGME
jgi:outer membrane protein OmpA-like peptidoglycan-associated protein